MNKKSIKDAATQYAKAQLGDEQFKKNKHAVKAISEDFKAGVEWAKSNLYNADKKKG